MFKKKNQHYKNEIYLSRNKYFRPKENFVMLIKLLEKEKKNINFSLLDVGCANGELLYNIKKKFNESNLTGIDVDQSLLDKAKKMCPKDIKFLKNDISKNKINIGKFDYVICCGVLSIFKDGKKILKNLKSLLKPKGKIFIFDSLNKYCYNLHIVAENYRNKKPDLFYKNVYSVQFIKKFFSEYKKKIDIIPFYLKTNLKRNKKNYIYNWTEYLSKKKIVTSALGLIQYQFWLKIY